MEEAASQSQIWTPVFQYGFAGFAAVLLSIIVFGGRWLIRQLLGVLKENNKVIDRNTAALNAVEKTTTDNLKLSRSVNDKLLSRPCIAKLEQAPP